MLASVSFQSESSNRRCCLQACELANKCGDVGEEAACPANTVANLDVKPEPGCLRDSTVACVTHTTMPAADLAAHGTDVVSVTEEACNDQDSHMLDENQRRDGSDRQLAAVQ